MKKIISFVFTFVFCFIGFARLTFADVVEIPFTDYSSIFDFSRYDDFDSSFRDYLSSNNIHVDFCYYLTTYSGNSYRMIDCADITNYTYSYDHNSNFFSFYSYRFKFQYSNFSNFSIVTSSTNQFLKFGGIFKAPFFWFYDDSLNLDLIVSDNSFVFSDDVYNSIPEIYKQYYNFKNYLVLDSPIYSYYHLLFGNYKGLSGSTIFHYCYDNVCNDTEIYNYKYGSSGEIIDLNNYFPLLKNGYDLDTSKDYKIESCVTTDLYVYYNSSVIDYSVNYWLDNVKDDSRSYKSSGGVGTTITLDNLDDVIDDIYFLDKSLDYSLTLSNDSSNEINVYYNTIDVNYDINIYLDDIYYKSYSQVNSGKVGQEIIIDELEPEIDIYVLDEREYKISLNENRELNYVNVYYYSENYNTKYQNIDTSDKFYISFDWVYIKELFNLNGNYTQTEQFIIVYSVNVLFYLMIFIISYFALKMIYKLFSIFSWL